MMQFDKEAIRSAMSNTLPKIEPEGDRSLRARYTYVPSSHEKALRLDVPLVEGMRVLGRVSGATLLSMSRFATTCNAVGRNLDSLTG